MKVCDGTSQNQGSKVANPRAIVEMTESCIGARERRKRALGPILRRGEQPVRAPDFVLEVLVVGVLPGGHRQRVVISSASPKRCATPAASVRERTLSLARIRETWTLAVFSDM